MGYEDRRATSTATSENLCSSGMGEGHTAAVVSGEELASNLLRFPSVTPRVFDLFKERIEEEEEEIKLES